MTDIGTLNFAWSQSMIEGFVASGITDAVISPGSRSTPLALAMLRHPRLRCHMVVDERCAAFFAVGVAKASRNPLLVLATSGSAPANWYPAIIEANQACVPLVFISADRPPELHGWGANQTVSQSVMFADHVRANHNLACPDARFNPDYLYRLTAKVVEQACWPLPGPVHINQPFREPLLPGAPTQFTNINAAPPTPHPVPSVPTTDIRDLAKCISGQPGIIICGEMPATPEQSAAIAELAAALNCPILAEPLSGLRFGPHDRSHLCVRYGLWLGNDAAALPQPEWVIRFGAYPVTRRLQSYLTSVRKTCALIEPWPRWSDPAHQLTHLLRCDPTATCQALVQHAITPAPASWMARFSELESMPPQTPDTTYVGTLIEKLPEDIALFVGNSLPIRQIDTFSGSRAKRLPLFANRGASGIDGNLSTVMGLATAFGRAAALVGDLTCQHDIGGLALALGKNVIVVVVNNNGGGIFEQLPQSRLPEFELGWKTPQQIDFSHAAATFGLHYAVANNQASYGQALDQALIAGGPHLIELKPC